MYQQTTTRLFKICVSSAFGPAIVSVSWFVSLLKPSGVNKKQTVYFYPRLLLIDREVVFDENRIHCFQSFVVQLLNGTYVFKMKVIGRQDSNFILFLFLLWIRQRGCDIFQGKITIKAALGRATN